MYQALGFNEESNWIKYDFNVHYNQIKICRYVNFFNQIVPLCQQKDQLSMIYKNGRQLSAAKHTQSCSN